VSDVRCRACGAAVPAEAQWCSLCFADLREPTPVRERVSVPAASTAAREEASVAAAAPSPNGVRPDPDALLGLPKPAADIDGDDTSAADEPEQVKWPCLTCGEQVPISLDACQSCGAGFLAGSTTQPTARLPMVGDLQRLSRNQRLGLGFSLCLVVMILLIVLATIGGHLL
jgi:hypothetical protein